eukprot:gene816-9066_t
MSNITLENTLGYIQNFEYTSETPFSHYTTPLAISFSYLLIIYVLKLLMNYKKEPFSLHYISLIHNINMTLLSLGMFLGLVYSLFDFYLQVGDLSTFFDLMLCDTNNKVTLKGPIYFICYIFYVSKFYELFDTVLIVLKKKPLIFLHVYHHFITLNLMFVLLHSGVPVQWLGATTNCFVHIVMYYYYALSLVKKDIWWKKYITQIQLIQFVINLVFQSLSFYYHYGYDRTCTSFNDSYGNEFAIFVIVSFLFLFLGFYSTNYKKKSTKKVE